MIRSIITAAAIVCGALIIKEAVMALGTETRNALGELTAAINEEFEQSSKSDAETAAAIREQIPNVRNIVRDAAPAEEEGPVTAPDAEGDDNSAPFDPSDPAAQG